MDLSRRDRVAAGLALLGLTLGLGALALGHPDPGVQIGRQDDLVVVQWVQPGSQAQRDGVLPGMVVTEVNAVQLLELPTYVYPEVVDPEVVDPENPDVMPTPAEPEVRPSRPTPVGISDDALVSLLSGGIRSFSTIQPWDLERGAPDAWNVQGYYYDDGELLGTAFPYAVGVLLLFGGVWWLRTGRAGTAVQPLALPLSVAVAMPFLLRPVEAAWWPVALGASTLLLVVAMLPLATALIELVEGETERRLVGLAAAACAAIAILAALATLESEGLRTSAVRWALVSAIPLLPGIAAAGPVALRSAEGTPGGTGRLLQSTEYAVAGATPMFALATGQDAYLFPLSLWLLVVAAAGRFTIRPLARLATRATLQRDLVVAATEAERARVAADIHDDALQELSLLVRRLDAAGDAEGADIARTVSDRLRAICGDLRLPILDDLGVGPALDWLVLRIERLAGGEVRLERTDGTRPPPDVELAFFRVAQEALANAVKHGRPPIVVSYRATPAGASLSVDDAGPGIAPDAGTTAELDGRLGMLNMQQRAEQIGAILDIRRWPGGGTHVALEWRPR